MSTPVLNRPYYAGRPVLDKRTRGWKAVQSRRSHFVEVLAMGSAMIHQRRDWLRALGGLGGVW